MQLFLNAIFWDLLGVAGARDCGDWLVSNRYSFSPADKTIDHRQNWFRRRTQWTQTLTADNIDVERSKWLFRQQMSQQSARRRIRHSIAVARFAGFYECRHFSSYVRQPKTLQDSTKSRLVLVMLRVVQRAKHFYSERREQHNSRQDSSLTIVFTNSFVSTSCGQTSANNLNWGFSSMSARVVLDVSVDQRQTNCTASTLRSEPVGASL